MWLYMRLRRSYPTRAAIHSDQYRLARFKMAEISPRPKRRSAERIKYPDWPRVSPSSITERMMRGTSRLSPVRVSRISRVPNICQKYGFKKTRIRIKCFIGISEDTIKKASEVGGLWEEMVPYGVNGSTMPRDDVLHLPDNAAALFIIQFNRLLLIKLIIFSV